MAAVAPGVNGLCLSRIGPGNADQIDSLQSRPAGNSAERILTHDEVHALFGSRVIDLSGKVDLSVNNFIGIAFDTIVQEIDAFLAIAVIQISQAGIQIGVLRGDRSTGSANDMVDSSLRRVRLAVRTCRPVHISKIRFRNGRLQDLQKVTQLPP